MAGRIGEAQRFFREVLAKGDLGGAPLDLARLKVCITNYLSLVSIQLEPGDSPHRIFESLNNTGMPLTASDLVRNHIFMSIKTEAEQNSAYKTYWYPMQQRMEIENGSSELTDFFWRYLMMDGSLPRYDEVFESLRKRIDNRIDNQMEKTSIVDVLKELDRYSEYYLKLRKPETAESSLPIRRQLERLNQWEVDVAYPFMLTAMHERQQGHVSDEQLLQVLCMIESYVVRRIVCGVPTNRLRRVFARMAGQVKQGDYVETCRQYLLDNEWPSDSEFGRLFKTTRIYIPSRLSRTRLILASLEESFAHHEPVELSANITVEHVMPQTLNDEWRDELGPSASDIHERYLHTIGNLTFSGYNSEMGNAPFATKKQVYAQSHFELNQAIVHAAQWTETAIQQRAEDLANRALVIWKRTA